MAKLQSGTRIYGTANVDTILYVNTYAVVNATGIYTTGTSNAASYTVGSSFIANTTGAYHTGTINAASFTVGTVFTANATLVNAVAISTSTNTVTIGTAAYHVSNGNFGIANSAPADKLAVAGTSYFNGNAVFNGVAAFYNVNGQANASAGAFVGNAYATLGGSSGNYLAFGQQTSSAQWIQSGYSSIGAPAYYSIILNPLGGNIGIGNTAPSDRLSVNGTTYLGNNTTIVGNTTVVNVYSTGTINAAAVTIGTAFSVNSTFANVSIPLSTTANLSVNGAIFLSNGTGSNSGLAGQVLTSSGSGNAYWSTVSGGGGWTGGTMANTVTFSNLVTITANLTVNGAIFLSNGTGSNSGSAGQVLTSNGNSNAYWSTITASFTGGTVTGATTFSANVITTANVYVNSAIFLGGSNGQVGQVLTSNGTSNAYWSTVSGGGGGSFTNGSSVAVSNLAFTNSGGGSVGVAYSFINTASGSLDTVFA
jgi:hypothetical protein